jgi:hypothetical protein
VAYGGDILSSGSGMILLGRGEGVILAATSVQMASTAVEVRGGNDGGPNVGTGCWNPNNSDTILEARLGNPRQGWGWGYK